MNIAHTGQVISATIKAKIRRKRQNKTRTWIGSIDLLVLSRLMRKNIIRRRHLHLPSQFLSRPSVANFSTPFSRRERLEGTRVDFRDMLLEPSFTLFRPLANVQPLANGRNPDPFQMLGGGNNGRVLWWGWGSWVRTSLVEEYPHTCIIFIG